MTSKLQAQLEMETCALHVVAFDAHPAHLDPQKVAFYRCWAIILPTFGGLGRQLAPTYSLQSETLNRYMLRGFGLKALGGSSAQAPGEGLTPLPRLAAEVSAKAPRPETLNPKPETLKP